MLERKRRGWRENGSRRGSINNYKFQFLSHIYGLQQIEPKRRRSGPVDVGVLNALPTLGSLARSRTHADNNSRDDLKTIIIDGQIVGAVGVSGAATAQQDEELALAGAHALATSSAQAE